MSEDMSEDLQFWRGTITESMKAQERYHAENQKKLDDITDRLDSLTMRIEEDYIKKETLSAMLENMQTDHSRIEILERRLDRLYNYGAVIIFIVGPLFGILGSLVGAWIQNLLGL